MFVMLVLHQRIEQQIQSTLLLDGFNARKNLLQMGLPARRGPSAVRRRRSEVDREDQENHHENVPGQEVFRTEENRR